LLPNYFLMKKPRLIFYLIFFLLQLGMFTFSLVVEDRKNDFEFLFSLHGFIPSLKYVTFIGLILLIIDFVWYNITLNSHSKELEHLKSEHNSIKAKLFDMQVAVKEANVISDPQLPEEEENTEDPSNETS